MSIAAVVAIISIAAIASIVAIKSIATIAYIASIASYNWKIKLIITKVTKSEIDNNGIEKVKSKNEIKK